MDLLLPTRHHFSFEVVSTHLVLSQAVAGGSLQTVAVVTVTAYERRGINSVQTSARDTCSREHAVVEASTGKHAVVDRAIDGQTRG